MSKAPDPTSSGPSNLFDDEHHSIGILQAADGSYYLIAENRFDDPLVTVVPLSGEQLERVAARLCVYIATR